MVCTIYQIVVFKNFFIMTLNSSKSTSPFPSVSTSFIISSQILSSPSFLPTPKTPLISSAEILPELSYNIVRSNQKNSYFIKQIESCFEFLICEDIFFIHCCYSPLWVVQLPISVHVRLGKYFINLFYYLFLVQVRILLWISLLKLIFGNKAVTINIYCLKSVS